MKYAEHLRRDKKMKKLLDSQEPVRLTRRKPLHRYLIGSIMSQQLSTQVARVIQKRFLDLFEDEPRPEDILALPVGTLRAIGLSRAKADYVHNVARFCLEKGLDYETLDRMTDAEILAYLTQIKGVGRWTAQMLLMFSLGREDVFAVDDLGIQQAMRKLYRLDKLDKKEFREAMQRIARKWSPYRTYACVHLWSWKDEAPTAKGNRSKN